MDEYEDRPLSEAREPVMLLFVGILILLLSFFAILNYGSTPDGGRTRSAMASVVTSFDPSSRAAGRLTSSTGDVPGDASFSTRLGAVVATQFPLTRVVVTRPGRVFLVELPIGHVWLDDDVAPSDGGQRFIAALVPILASPPAGTAYQSEVRVVAAPDANRSLAVARASAFADAVEAAGAPVGTVASGLDAGQSDFLRLVFTVQDSGDGRR